MTLSRIDTLPSPNAIAGLPHGTQIIAEPARVTDWLRSHSHHPLSLLLKNENGRIFSDCGGGGIGFIDTGGALLCIGGIVAGERPASAILKEFCDWCDVKRVKARFVHFTRDEAILLEKQGYRIEQIGASYEMAYEKAELTGSKFRQVRRKLSNAQRAGISVEEITNLARFNEVKPQLAEINAQWLREKRAKPLRHLVYAFDLISPSMDERVFVAWHNGVIIAYLVFSRVLRDNEQCWFHNLSRRRTGCVDGTMQAMVAAFLATSPPGVLNFGFTPLVEMQASEFQHSRVFASLARWLSDRGGLVYPARAQRQYKISWAPQTIIPEYFAYRENTLIAALGLLRTTNSI
jgi:lysylphosphatidylglycerol synthetase-like protein (DUF2156 family)